MPNQAPEFPNAPKEPHLERSLLCLSLCFGTGTDRTYGTLYNKTALTHASHLSHLVRKPIPSKLALQRILRVPCVLLALGFVTRLYYVFFAAPAE